MLFDESYLFDASWIFFAAWTVVVLAVSVIAFAKDLMPPGRRFSPQTSGVGPLSVLDSRLAEVRGLKSVLSASPCTLAC